MYTHIIVYTVPKTPLIYVRDQSDFYRSLCTVSLLINANFFSPSRAAGAPTQTDTNPPKRPPTHTHTLTHFTCLRIILLCTYILPIIRYPLVSLAHAMQWGTPGTVTEAYILCIHATERVRVPVCVLARPKR